MAGSVWEWVLDRYADDWYAGTGNNCQNCANLVDGNAGTMKGGNFEYNAADMRGANRFAGTLGAYWRGAGMRCARDTP